MSVKMCRCPNCGLENSNGRDHEYWGLVQSFERLAAETGSIRDLVMLTENRLRCVAHRVSSGNSSDLVYNDHWNHVFAAKRLLDSAIEAKQEMDKKARLDKTKSPD